MGNAIIAGLIIAGAFIGIDHTADGAVSDAVYSFMVDAKNQ